MSKHILILSPFFFPEPISTGKYNTYIAKELSKAGNKVDVICSHPLYPNWNPESTNKTLNGIRIFRGGEKIKYPRSQYIRRLFLEVWYTFFVLKVLTIQKNKYDIIIPIFPPSLFFVIASIFLPNQTEVRGIVHDLQGIYANQSKNLVTKLLFKLIILMEGYAFKSCNTLIFLSYEMKSYTQKKYKMPNTKMEVHYPFYNVLPFQKKSGSDSGNFIQGSKIQKLFQLKSNSRNLKIVYSGALGTKQNPEGLIEFLKLISHLHDDIVCHIFSGGPIYEKYAATSLINQDADQRLYFHPLVDESQVSELYHHSSCQIIPQKSGTSSGSLPSKLPNLVKCGVPIFCMCDFGSEISNIILENKLGSVSHSWNPLEMAETFNFFRETYLDIPKESFASKSSITAEKMFNISEIINTLSD